MPAPKLYNWSTKQWDMVPDHQVTQGVADGAYSFEHGLDVPVVAPDGALGTVPSQHVQEAFKNGYRWQTADDQKAFDEQQNQQIMDDHYGSTSDAFIGGVVEGGIPGAVPMMQGIAKAMGQDPNAITQGMNQLQAHSPTAMFAGNLAGAVASPITEALGGAANGVGAKLATGAIDTGFEAAAAHAPELAARLAGKGLVGTASKIVDQFAPKVIGGALEGAYFGLHDGVNEAALGDPSQAAETLMSSVGDGLVFGGAGGAVVEGLSKAATPIKSLLSGKLDLLADASTKAAQAAAKGATLPAFDKADRSIVSEFIDNESLRNLMFYGGGKDAVEDLGSRLASTSEAVRSEQSGLLQDFKYAIKNTPKAIQSEINASLNVAGGDFYKATDQAWNSHLGSKMALDAEMAKNVEAGSFAKPMFDDAEKLIDTLGNSGHYVGEQKANELANYLNAQKANIAREAGLSVDHPELAELVTAGHEQQIAQQLLEFANSTKSSLPDALQAKIENFSDGLTYLRHNQDQFGAAVTNLDNKYEALNKLRDFVSDKTGNLEKTVVDRLKADPEYAHEFDALMTHFPETAPILKNFSAALADPLKAQLHLNSLKQLIRDAGVRTYGRMGAEDFSKVADMIGDANLQDKAERLKAVQAAMQDPNAGPITKMIKNLQALGRPVPDIFQKLEPHQQGLERMAELLGGVEPTVVERMLTKMTRGVIKGSAFGLVAPFIGSAVGHSLFHGPIGVLAGGAAGAVGRRMFNPVSNLETLTKLQKGIRKGFDRLDGATQGAIDALTSKDAARTLMAAGPKLSGWDDKQKAFQERMKYLTKLQDPAALQQQAEDRFGASTVAPNLTSAIHGQYAKTVQFLTSKLPQDPLMHLGLSSDHSQYTPSDMEMAKFERYHQAAVDPVSTLNNIAAMRATPQEIETHQALYPSHFERLQQGVLDAIMKPDIKLSYQQRLQIGQMFGVPSAVSMRPDFVMAMQSNFKNDKGQGPQPSGLKANPKVAFDPQSQSTETERITYQ